MNSADEKSFILRKNENKAFTFLKRHIIEIILGIGIVFIHLYKLSAIPYGTHVDEMGMGVNAWCIANYGVDRFLNSYPAYVGNFNGGQSALYTYLCALFIKCFGFSVTAIRLPAVLFAAITAIFGYKITLTIWEKKSLGILFLYVYMVLPYFLMVSRIGLDCNLMLGMATVFLYFCLITLKNPSTRNYFICGITASLVLYSYAVSYIVVPIFLILLVVYAIYLKKINLKMAISFMVPLLMISFPLVMVQIINMFNLPEMKIGFMTLIKIPVYRSYQVNTSGVLEKIIGTVKSIFMYDSYAYNTSKAYLTMYWISIPLIAIGFLYELYILFISIKNRKYYSQTIILFWAISMFLLGCVLEDTGVTNKINGIFIAMIIFILAGIYCIGLIPNKIKYILIAIIVGAYGFYFLNFCKYYFQNYTEDTYPIAYCSSDYGDALKYIESIPGSDKKLIYIGLNTEGYIYFMGNKLISPYEFRASESGTETYKNYVFHLAYELDLDAYYIVLDTDEYYLDELKQNGFICQKMGDYYACVPE